MADQKVRSGNGKLIAAGILLVIFLALILDNTRKVRVGFVFTDKSVPLVVVLVIAAALGAILDRLWMYSRRDN